MDTPAPTFATTNGSHPETEASEPDRVTIATLERRERIAKIRAEGWKVALGGGQWATLCDPDIITERKLRPIKVAMLNSVELGADGMQHPKPAETIAGGYIVVAAFLTDWSFQLPVPTPENFESLMDLPSRDFATLSSVASDLREEAFREADPAAGVAAN